MGAIRSLATIAILAAVVSGIGAVVVWIMGGK